MLTEREEINANDWNKLLLIGFKSSIKVSYIIFHCIQMQSIRDTILFTILDGITQAKTEGKDKSKTIDIIIGTTRDKSLI